MTDRPAPRLLPASTPEQPIADAAPLVDRLAYSVAEAAEATGLSRDLLYDEMRAGRLAYLKVGRRRIITRQHLHAFLTENQAGRAPRPGSRA